jgi:hypothetical protein
MGVLGTALGQNVFGPGSDGFTEAALLVARVALHDDIGRFT